MHAINQVSVYGEPVECCEHCGAELPLELQNRLEDGAESVLTLHHAFERDDRLRFAVSLIVATVRDEDIRAAMERVIGEFWPTLRDLRGAVER